MIAQAFLKKYSARINFFALCCVAGVLFFLPSVMIIKNILLVLSLIVIVLVLHYQRIFSIWRDHHYILWLVLLWFFYLGAVSYSAAPVGQALAIVFKDNRFLLPLLLIPFFVGVLHEREKLIKYFIAGVLFSFLICIFAAIFPAPILSLTQGKYELAYPWINHIFGSFIDSFAVFLCLHKMTVDKTKWRYFFALAALAATIHVWFFNQSRTGYVEFVLLGLLFLIQKRQVKLLLFAMVLAAVMSMVIMKYSENFKSRMGLFLQEQQGYNQGHDRDSSTGWRRYVTKKSLILWSHKPWLGYGPAAFQPVFIKTFCTEQPCSVSILGLATNPQNQFLLVLVETGAIGFGLFVLFLVSAWRHTYKLDPMNQYLGQGLLISFIALCLSDVALMASVSGDFFIVMSSLLLAYDPKAVTKDAVPTN